MSVLAVTGACPGVEAVLALRVARDVVWIEVVGGTPDGVVDDVLFGLHGLSHWVWVHSWTGGLTTGLGVCSWSWLGGRAWDEIRVVRVVD